jgi:hypothetical protein
MAVAEAFPTGPAFLLAKSSFPSLKTPTVLSQQELGNPIGRAFANRVGVFANILALLAKRAFPVVIELYSMLDFDHRTPKQESSTIQLLLKPFTFGHQGVSVTIFNVVDAM